MLSPTPWKTQRHLQFREEKVGKTRSFWTLLIEAWLRTSGRKLKFSGFDRRNFLGQNKKRPGFKESRDARTALPQNCSRQRYKTIRVWGRPLPREFDGTEEPLANSYYFATMSDP